jgi:hypothetical protein
MNHSFHQKMAIKFLKELFVYIEKQIALSQNVEYIYLTQRLLELLKQSLELDIIPTVANIQMLENIVHYHWHDDLRNEIIEYAKIIKQVEK